MNKITTRKGPRTSPPFLYALLLSSALVTPAKGMMDDWQDLFNADKSHFDVKLGSKILIHLDDRSLGRLAQVNKNCQQLISHTRYDRLDEEKQQLYSLILEVTGAEPNEVQRAHDRLDYYLTVSKREEEHQKEQEAALFKILMDLKARLLQPESLVRSNDTLFNQLLTAHELSVSHDALRPLVKLIEDLGKTMSLISHKVHLRGTLSAVKNHYETYLNQLLSPQCDRARHLHPKALLSGEGFLGCYGQGVPKDEKQAIEWYTKAAEQGDVTAPYNLGVMYDTGRGVEKDKKTAMQWYTKAADQGHEGAKIALSRSRL